MEKRKDYFACVTGMRGIACLGIVAYHVCMLCDFQGTWIFDLVIRNFDAFVRLFFVISGFSMMCGYFRKVYFGELSLEAFYVRRFGKLLPFFYFALIVNICIAKFRISPFNFFGTASLLFGLMPTHQTSVVSAAWALGLIFVFYFIFPAFTVAVATRKRAWVSLAVSIGLLISYLMYYGIGVENDYINILRQSVWFVLGALFYQYRTILKDTYCRYPLVYLMMSFSAFICGIFLYFVQKDLGMGVCFSGLMAYCVTDKSILLQSRAVYKLSSISYEIYLLHVPAFRIVQTIFVKRLKILRLFSNDILEYMCIFILTMAVVIPSVLGANWILGKLKNILKE